MAEEPAASKSGPGGLAGLVRAHPILSAIFATCALLGAVLGVLYLPPEWSLARRLAAGVFSGVGIGLFCTVTRIFGKGE
jgi:hypothetical protein